MKKFREWLDDMGYETASAFLGEVIAFISLFILLFMISVIGG